MSCKQINCFKRFKVAFHKNHKNFKKIKLTGFKKFSHTFGVVETLLAYFRDIWI